MKVTINARAIRAVSNHAAQGDPRFYLNAVILRPAKGGGVLAIATDGAHLAIVHDPSGSWEGDTRPIILHRNRACAGGNGPYNMAKGWKESALAEAVKASKDDRAATVTSDGVSASVECGGVTIAARYVDGRVPDFGAVIPATYRPDPSGVSARLLSDACETCEVIDPKYAGAILHTGGHNGLIVMTATERKPAESALRAFCLVMALRTDGQNKADQIPMPDHAAWILNVL